MSIKLIAADMDGTLLSSRKQLPKGFFPLVRTLKKIGVRFAPASGRQYYNLYEQFGEIADELIVSIAAPDLTLYKFGTVVYQPADLIAGNIA